MNLDQIRKLTGKLMLAFPTYGNFVRDNSESVKETLTKQLSTIDYLDCDKVVDRLIMGDLEMPPNYEFDRVGQVLRRWAGQIADRRREQSENAERLAEKKEAFSWLADASGDMGDERARWCVAMRQVIANGQSARERKMTREEKDRRKLILKQWWQAGGEFPVFADEGAETDDSNAEIADLS